VTTTGGTLSACRQALVAGGAAAVYAAAVARADATEPAAG
jgi:predicted amidophosphoribosyltransferase